MRIIAGLVFFLVFGVCAVTAAVLCGPMPLADWLSSPGASLSFVLGENPAPIALIRPAIAPLSPMALLGRQIFHDQTLSGSGRLACASCHSAAHAYGPPNDLPAMYGGAGLAAQGARAVPSLMYLDQQPYFSIGPDTDSDNDAAAAPPPALLRVTKTALDNAAAAANTVPQGGLFWDGRANTLQDQAIGPLLNPFEMAGGSVARVAGRLRAAPYGPVFAQRFNPGIFNDPDLVVAEAMFAVERFEIEDPSFHPYDSRYDAWLEGKARLSLAEMRGYFLFNDPNKADCAGCHLDQPGADHHPPLFTDHQFEALGVPRNPALAVNQDPAYEDLGICGPYRSDMVRQTQYCGLFITPSLRNVATRRVFFHNGEYHTLQQVMDFYDFRDTDPAKIYPRGADGGVRKFNDLPPSDWANIDIIDPPLDRHLGQRPAMTQAEERDIIAFLQTLTDGFTK